MMSSSAGPTRRPRRRHAIQWRLLLLFLLLALAVSGVFLFGMQKALGVGWRDAARPLLADYVDRVAAELGSPPSVERAQALVQRLPVTVRITGPQVNWQSHPAQDPHRWRRDAWMDDAQVHDGERLFSRQTADGHRVDFGLSMPAWRERPRFIGWATLGVLLLFTLAAWAYLRHLLRPLSDISAGAKRFGSGDFSEPIAVKRRDELGDLAADVNAMAANIHSMLEAKRNLLLAISHELRSPITRARLNSELLDESGPTGTRRAALLRDLQEMASLITDLLESERLGAGHSALQREWADPVALARDVVDAFEASHTGARVALKLEAELADVSLDPARIRLLLRNLLDNAWRHSGSGAMPPELQVALEGPWLVYTVSDHGPGVPAEVLSHLAQPFYRPDRSRDRETGGVGLGLYLCKQVALAHGGSLDISNRSGAGDSGLQVRVQLPRAGA
jgi:signal transduction histidine kinase